MDKEQLINVIAAKTGFTKKNTRIFLEAFTGTVTDSLSDGDNVKIVGFGNFKIERRNPRVGRDKTTNTKVIIPERIVPVFTPGKALRDKVADREFDLSK